MLFDEVVLVEFLANTIKDLVVVEGSKDNGASWQEFLSPYASSANTVWRNAFLLNNVGSPTLFRSRLINLTESGNFSSGENVLIRFRLQSDGAINGWGWAIDNLSIQGPVTGLEETDLLLQVYPNPVTSNLVSVEVRAAEPTAHVQILNALGQPVFKESLQLDETNRKIEINTSNWTKGIYFVRVELPSGTILTKKLINAH